MSRNPRGINFFGWPLIAGRPLARNVGLIDKINTLCKVLEQLDGANGINIVRNGKEWTIVFNASAIVAGGVGDGLDGLTWDEVVAALLALDDEMLSPNYVLCKKTVSGVTTIGWVATCNHADEHPESP